MVKIASGMVSGMKDDSRWKNDSWWVSPYNFIEETFVDFPKDIEFEDITLRDGEQQAGVVLRKEDKMAIALKLAEVGVERIEAGMPAVSEDDKAAVKEIAKEVDAKIFAFTRCMKSDVELALECGVDGVIMEIPSSTQIVEYAYGWTMETAMRKSIEATAYAGEHGLYTCFFCIDSTRADINWYLDLMEKVSTEGHADSFALVDTFGVCTPETIRYMTKKIIERLGKPVEMHMHNDFGLAVANSIAGLQAGGQVVHTTVNAIGERLGNCSLEEILCALQMLYGVDLSHIKFDKLYELSKLVQERTNVIMPGNKPIVGDNFYASESGIVIGWWERLKKLGMPLVMFPIHPKAVGQDDVHIVLGKKSGISSIRMKAEELGFSEPTDDQAMDILAKVKEFAIENKRKLTNEEFEEIAKGVLPF
jgi:isopropylmalate/homocitrate/citramalate synthase